ncbi:MAG: putative membrane protein YfcA [Arenicella sp.]
MEILGYSTALLIGLSLGLMGGGGSILTVPVMVYIFGFNPILATAYSLFVVGVSSFIGMLGKLKQKLVSFRIAIIFAIPAFVSVFFTRRYLLPMLPETLLDLGGFEISKSVGIMLLFAIVMLVASFSMIRGRKQLSEMESKGGNPTKTGQIMLQGLGVGLLTGIVGAGGGFLIIPALVLLAKLPMKTAVGTSLLIISANSLVGFVGDLQSGSEIDWKFLLIFTSIAILGILVGNYFSTKIEGAKLKKGFGWFVLIMAIVILGKELL